MKRFTFIFIICLFFLSGCFNVASSNYRGGWKWTAVDLTESDYTEANNTIKDSSAILLVKVNPNKASFYKSDSGYVIETTDFNNHVIEKDENYYNQNRSLETSTDDVVYNHDKFMRRMTKDVFKTLNNSYNDSRGLSTSEPKKELKTIIDNNKTIGDTRDFRYCTNSKNDNQMDLEEATCYYNIKDVCNVWYIPSGYQSLDQNFTNDTKKIKAIAEVFSNIQALEEKLCGSHTYEESFYSNVINPVQTIDIVICDIYHDALTTQNTHRGVVGYFSPSDMIKDSFYGNNTQAIYIDSYFLAALEKMVHSTIVHEYNHLLNFVNKKVKYGLDYETWFTEMLSMVAEDLFEDYLEIDGDDGPKQRVPYFVESANYGFNSWESNDDTISAYMYANTYMYGAFIGRNFGGPEIIHQIATNEYVDEISIAKAIKNHPNMAKVQNDSADDETTFVSSIILESFVLFNTDAMDVNEGITLNNKNPLKWDTDNRLFFKGFDISGDIYIGNNQTVNVQNFYNIPSTDYYARSIYPYGLDVSIIAFKDDQNPDKPRYFSLYSNPYMAYRILRFL